MAFKYAPCNWVLSDNGDGNIKAVHRETKQEFVGTAAQFVTHIQTLVAEDIAFLAAGDKLYTWMRYADDAAGTGISASPTGKSYVGYAFNKASVVPSETPGDYSWSPLTAGAGTALYTWVRYADDVSGTGISADPTEKTFIGFAYNKSSATASDTPADYVWVEIASLWADSPMVHTTPTIPSAIYDAALNASGTVNAVMAADRMEVVPALFARDVTITEIGGSVPVALAEGQFRVVVYESGVDGWPGNKIYESGVLTTDALGFSAAAWAFTFKKGKKYWIGCHSSAAITLRGIPASGQQPVSTAGQASQNYRTILRVGSLAFASGAPATFPTVTDATPATGAIAPSIRWRAA